MSSLGLNSNAGVIISPSKSINLQKIRSLSEKGIIFSKDITLLDHYAIKNKGGNLIERLYNANATISNRVSRKSL